MVAKCLQRIFPLFGLATVLLLALSAPVVGAPGDNELVSVDIFTGKAAGGDAGHVSVSRDGRYVAFASDASTLVAGDTNGVGDVFVRDRVAGVTERISVGLGGIEANGRSYVPFISGDGRYVAFGSEASNLVASDLNARRDVFLHDRATGITTRVSVDPPDGLDFTWPVPGGVSDDGRFVVFRDTGGVLLRDLQARTTRRVGRSLNTTDSTISGNGRFVLYINYDEMSLVIHDRWTGSNEYIADAWYTVSVSRDGRWVAYGDTQNLYLLDRTTRQTRLVSCDAAGHRGIGESYVSSVSDEGRYVAFESYAPNLFPGDTEDTLDLFVKDMQTGFLEHVAPGMYASLSGDGRFVGFSTISSLVPSDLNSTFDAYLHEVSAYSSPPDVFDYDLRPFTVDYGQVGVGTALKKGFTLSNVGNAPLPISTLEVLGLHRSQFAVKSYCGSTVAVGQRCWISVTFKPTSVGYKQANLHVVAAGIERHRALRGTGT